MWVCGEQLSLGWVLLLLCCLCTWCKQTERAWKNMWALLTLSPFFLLFSLRLVCVGPSAVCDVSCLCVSCYIELYCTLKWTWGPGQASTHKGELQKLKMNVTLIIFYRDSDCGWRAKLFFPSVILHFSDIKRIHQSADVSQTNLQNFAQDKAIQQVFLSEEPAESSDLSSFTETGVSNRTAILR